MKYLLLSFFSLITLSMSAQNQAPQVANYNLSLADGSLVITFDLLDLEGDESLVSVYISNDNGDTYTIDVANAIGDVNTMVPIGNNKLITWDYGDILINSGEYVVKLVADDLNVVDIQSIVNQVDSTLLYNDLSFIEGDRHHNTGMEHLIEVRNHISDVFDDYSLDQTVTEFEYQSFDGKNYIGDIEGTDSDGDVYVLCAHYDGVSNSPAADDNGTAVAGMLEAVRILTQYNFKKTIRFIGLDLEEEGLVGSFNYVGEDIPENESIKGVLDFEMIGYATNEPNTQSFPTGFNILFPEVYAEVESQEFRGNFIANVGKVNQNEWELSFSNAAAEYVPDLRVINLVAPSNWVTLTPDLGRSDHAPFWLNNMPAVMLTGTANLRNPNYHASTDTIGSINFTFMSNVVEAAIATLAEEAQVQNSSWVKATIDISLATSGTYYPHIIFTPNPAKDFLYIDVPSNNNFVKIYDLMGKEVLFSEGDISTVSISNLVNGAYIIEIVSGETKLISKLIITR